MKHAAHSWTQHLADGHQSFGGDDAREQDQPGQHSDRTPPSIIQVTQSAETVAGTTGADRFIIHSLTEKDAVIDSFTLGQDHLVIRDPSLAPGDVASHLSLATAADGTAIVVDAGTAQEHTLVTLKGVAATDLASVVQAPHLPPSIIQLAQSGETVSGTAGADRFVLHGLSLHDETIGHFTVGQDVLRFAGHESDVARLSLAAHPGDATSTDVIVDAGTATAHTLATLTGVAATDLDTLLHTAGSSAAHTADGAASGSSQAGGSADSAAGASTGSAPAGTSTETSSTTTGETSTGSAGATDTTASGSTGTTAGDSHAAGSGTTDTTAGASGSSTTGETSTASAGSADAAASASSDAHAGDTATATAGDSHTAGSGTTDTTAAASGSSTTGETSTASAGSSDAAAGSPTEAHAGDSHTAASGTTGTTGAASGSSTTGETSTASAGSSDAAAGSSSDAHAGDSHSAATDTTAAAGGSSTTGTTTASAPTTAGDAAHASADAGSGSSADASHGTAAPATGAGTGTPVVKTPDFSDGHGHDVFVFDTFGSAPATIHDFHPGEDIIDVAPALKAAGYTGTDPITDGLLHVAADGANTTVLLGEVKVASLEHVQPTQLHASDFWH